MKAVVSTLWIAFLLYGCGPLFKAAPPPDYYGVEWKPIPAGSCSARAGALTVWPFRAAQPYDRTEMVLVRDGAATKLSEHHRWIAAPGEMLADGLIQVLSRTGLFEAVGDPADPAAASNLQMSGRIYRFALQQRGKEALAVADVRVILWTEDRPKKILFQRTYHLTERLGSQVSAEHFASAMSRALNQLTHALVRDLCAALEKTSESPDNRAQATP